MTPQELALYGALTGAGGYGATRLLHNAMKNVEDVITPASLNPDANLNQITLRLPRKQGPVDPMAPMQPKMAEVEKQADPAGLPTTITNNPPSSGGGEMENWQYLPIAAGSLGLGYYGASKLHDFFQRRMAENQLKATQKKFQDTIGQFQQSKMASETPLVDAYCEVMSAASEHLSKSAVDWNPLNWPSDTVHGITNLTNASGLLNPAKAPNGAPWSEATAAPGANTFWKDFAKPVGAGIGTLGVLKFLADKTQRMEQDDERNKAKLPQTINVVQE